MSKPNPKALLREAGNYLKEHPAEIMRALRGALGLRVGVPIDALRYLAREFGGGKKAPKDVVLEAAPPGLRVGMTVDAMGTPLRVSLVVYVEEIDVRTEAVQIGLRVAELKLDVLGDANSPLAGLLKSGALDLSRPDLMKAPKLAQNAKVARALRVVTPVLGIRAVKTKDDHLDVHLKASPSGLSAAITAARTES
jgi:hypothetical protein